MHYLLFIIIPLLPLQNIVDKIPKGPTGINFLNVSTMMLVAGWLLSSQKHRRPLIEPNGVNLTLGLFIALNFLGMWHSAFFLNLELPLSLSDPHLIFFKDYTTALALFWITTGIIQDERRMRHLVIAMAVILPYMFRVHYSHLMAASSWHYDHDMRVVGTFSHLGSNELAAFYTQYAMIFLCMFWMLSERKLRIFFLIATGLCLWGAVNSYSRASYIGLVVALVIFGLIKSRPLILATMGFLLIAPAVLPQSVMDRIEMTQSSDGELDESAASRLDFWELAWDKFLEYPLTGTGLHSFHHYNPAKLDTHNLYVRQFAELGFFGIVLFMALYWVTMRECVRLYKEADTAFLKALALGMILATIANMLLNIFGDRGSHLSLAGYYWVFMGLVVRGRILVAERAGQLPQGVDPPPPAPPPRPKASIFAEAGPRPPVDV